MRDDGSTLHEHKAHRMTVPPPHVTMESFMLALRQGDAYARRQLFLHYAPLLRDQARRAGVHGGDADAIVTTLLCDFVLNIESAAPPRDLVRYLLVAVRNRARTERRGRERREARLARGGIQGGRAHSTSVAEWHSEYSLDAARGTEIEDPQPLSSVITKLVGLSRRHLTDADLSLMIAVSHYVPFHEIGRQVGITAGHARVKVHRLREQMKKLVRLHAQTLDDPERLEMERFLRRAGIMLVETRAIQERPQPETTRSQQVTEEDDHDTR